MKFERLKGKERREQRKVEAQERQKEYDSLSLQEKANKMAQSPGDSKKQSAKLAAKLKAQENESSKKKTKRSKTNKS